LNRNLALYSIAVAVLIEALLWGVRGGPGWLILLVVTASASESLRRSLERPFKKWTLLLWLVALMFATGPCLYDAELVHNLAPPLCVVAMLLAVYHSLARHTQLDHLARCQVLTCASVGQAYAAASGAFPVPQRSFRQGVLSALPLLAIFGSLFLQADPGYARAVENTLRGWPDGVFLAVRLLAWSWLAAALLFQARNAELPEPGQTSAWDGAAWATTLNCVNLLFLSFLLCQTQYLFAGRAPEGFTLAEYARRGFFELFNATLFVVALVVWLHDRVYHSPARQSSGRAAQLLLLLTTGLVFSSAWRMSLYISHFGLTLTRAYVVATLLGITLTLVLCWVALLFWKSPAWLQSRLLLLGLFSLGGVGLTNIEAWVARVNLARCDTDYAYLATLSSDMAVALRPQVSAERKLLTRLSQQAPLKDWREWNLSRHRVNMPGVQKSL